MKTVQLPQMHCKLYNVLSTEYNLCFTLELERFAHAMQTDKNTPIFYM